ncbi:MAG: hypothetical protein GYA34_11095 [Chloroflexi bacterium]|nr:hypothetical protein [Chloroflexota bacterium]
MNQENITPKKEGGAIFIFNYDAALQLQLNPQRHFNLSIMKSFCPKNELCPQEIRAAFYELRVGPIDKTNWESLGTFTRGERCSVNPKNSKKEDDFITGKNANRLFFSPYVVAVWSDVNTAPTFIHRYLEKNNVNGYIGSIFLDSIHTIEKFHSMCRQIDLGFDVLIKNGGYLYPKGSDHPLKPEVMASMGFALIEQ